MHGLSNIHELMAQEGRDEKGKFAKGNLFQQFVQNWNGGRPPKYQTPLELAEKIGEYLDYEDTLKRPDSYSKSGKGIYTLSGCALYLGFVSTSALQSYEKKDPLFSRVISAFRLFMTDWNEKKLYYMGTFPGSKLWLTNFGGYSEESTVNQNVTEYKTKWAEGDK
jgi:hypothetical protein